MFEDLVGKIVKIQIGVMEVMISCNKYLESKK